MIAARASPPTVAFWAGLGLLLIAVMLAWAFLPIREWVESFTSWTGEFGLLGAIVFASVYVVAVVALAPVWPRHSNSSGASGPTASPTGAGGCLPTP